MIIGTIWLKKIIALPDLSRIPSQPFVATRERGVHIVVLIWRNAVVTRNRAVGQISCQLLGEESEESYSANDREKELRRRTRA